MCVSQAFTCVSLTWEQEKKKKGVCVWGDYDSGMQLTACPFINLQSKSRFPGPVLSPCSPQKAQRCRALTTMPCGLLMNGQPCKEIQ